MFITFFILGLIIGSFVNAVVYRLNAVESLWDRSHCPKCSKKIRWHDNIPLLSFFLLSMKCRDCGEKISWQYPVVEFATGIVFGILGNYFFIPEIPDTWLKTLYYLTIFSILLIILVYDLKYMEIPMIVLWIGVAVAIAYLFYADWRSFQGISSYFNLEIVSGMIGGMVAFLFFYSLAYFSKETWMGYGDAYLGLLSGLFLKWPNILGALLLAFVVGSIVSVGLILAKKKTMKSQVPFAPFMAIGVFLAVIVAESFPEISYMFFLFN